MVFGRNRRKPGNQGKSNSTDEKKHQAGPKSTKKNKQPEESRFTNLTYAVVIRGKEIERDRHLAGLYELVEIEEKMVCCLCVLLDTWQLFDKENTPFFQRGITLGDIVKDRLKEEKLEDEVKIFSVKLASSLGLRFLNQDGRVPIKPVQLEKLHKFARQQVESKDFSTLRCVVAEIYEILGVRKLVQRSFYEIDDHLLSVIPNGFAIRPSAETFSLKPTAAPPPGPSAQGGQVILRGYGAEKMSPLDIKAMIDDALINIYQGFKEKQVSQERWIVDIYGLRPCDRVPEWCFDYIIRTMHQLGFPLATGVHYMPGFDRNQIRKKIVNVYKLWQKQEQPTHFSEGKINKFWRTSLQRQASEQGERIASAAVYVLRQPKKTENTTTSTVITSTEPLAQHKKVVAEPIKPPAVPFKPENLRSQHIEEEDLALQLRQIEDEKHRLEEKRKQLLQRKSKNSCSATVTPRVPPLDSDTESESDSYLDGDTGSEGGYQEGIDPSEVQVGFGVNFSASSSEEQVYTAEEFKKFQNALLEAELRRRMQAQNHSDRYGDSVASTVNPDELGFGGKQRPPASVPNYQQQQTYPNVQQPSQQPFQQQQQLQSQQNQHQQSVELFPSHFQQKHGHGLVLAQGNNGLLPPPNVPGTTTETGYPMASPEGNSFSDNGNHFPNNNNQLFTQPRDFGGTNNNNSLLGYDVSFSHNSQPQPVQGENPFFDNSDSLLGNNILQQPRQEGNSPFGNTNTSGGATEEQEIQKVNTKLFL